MMRKYYASVLMLALVSLSSVCQAQKPVELFNGKNLKNWIPYLQSASQDVRQEFRAEDGVIRLSGQFGYIRTNKEYENYKLTAEWRWPDTVSNSGIFLHLQPEFKIWPENFECQLRAGDAGDIYNSGGATCDQYKGEDQPIVAKQNPSNEKPQGEWNQAEIICTGDTITVYINGLLQNQITGLSQTKGFIGLQSEGEPVEFRNVVLTPIPRPKKEIEPADKTAPKEAAEEKTAEPRSETAE